MAKPIISLPKNDPRLKDCKPHDILMIRVRTLPGDEESAEEDMGEDEGAEEATIQGEVQSIEKVAKSPMKPKSNPMEYIKGKNDGKMAKMGY